jgi:hypothetical protein
MDPGPAPANLFWKKVAALGVIFIASTINYTILQVRPRACSTPCHAPSTQACLPPGALGPAPRHQSAVWKALPCCCPGVQAMRDAIIVTACGAEALPFISAFGVLPASLAFFVYYVSPTATWQQCAGRVRHSPRQLGRCQPRQHPLRTSKLCTSRKSDVHAQVWGSAAQGTG